MLVIFSYRGLTGTAIFSHVSCFSEHPIVGFGYSKIGRAILHHAGISLIRDSSVSHIQKRGRKLSEFNGTGIRGMSKTPS